DEGAVGVEAITLRDVGQGLADGVAGVAQALVRATERATHADDQGLVQAVGPGFLEAGLVAAVGGVGHVEINRGEIAAARLGAECAMHQGQDAAQGLRRADLPIPPVAVAAEARAVTVGVHPGQPIDHGAGKRGIAVEARAGRDLGARHQQEAGVVAGQHRGIAAALQIGPQARRAARQIDGLPVQLGPVGQLSQGGLALGQGAGAA
ncbi:Uncharacterized protein APZ42_002368, partial [Daphnia magna]